MLFAKIGINRNFADMKWLHNLLKGASLTTALFIFQACYGIPQPALYVEDGTAPMSFSLVSRKTGEPLQGIQIKGCAVQGYGYTDLGVTGEDGRCSVDIPYNRNQEGPFLHFEDPQGRVAAKDTTLADLRKREILIQMVPQE